MPFISPESRWILESGAEPETVGDICYLYYKPMMQRWNETRRWTTAHNIYKEWAVKRTDPQMKEDEIVAGDLAWQVFFAMEVMPYELAQREKNGDVD